MSEVLEPFTVWCVLSDSKVQKFGSGPRKDPWTPIRALYESKTEALQYAKRKAGILPKNGVWPRERPGETPIAWLVTFIILMQETGEATYAVQPCFGGTVGWNDDRDVMAIFPAEALAKEYAASENSSG
jgi:hypothetical protein